MPKRSLDSGTTTGTMDKIQKKTERSHEENQERAYIAASRRADRSIEARVQSARMASSIHKKRTGRGFKVTEEIVMKEEMYEEEEDEFPRHYRALTAHLQTGSADMNNRLNAYVSNHVALANLAHQQQVDRMFAEQFPNAAQISQRMSNSMYFQPVNTNRASTPYSPVEYSPTTTNFPKGRSRSIMSTSSAGTMPPLGQNGMSHGSASPVSPHASIDAAISPSAMTASSGGSNETHKSNQSSLFNPSHGYSTPVMRAVDPLATLDHNQQSQSLFTAELPSETKLLGNFDSSDPLTSVYYGDTGELMGSDGVFNFMDPNATTTFMSEPISAKSDIEYFNMPSSRQGFDASRIGTPGGGQGDSWESWVQYD